MGEDNGSPALYLSRLGSLYRQCNSSLRVFEGIEKVFSAIRGDHCQICHERNELEAKKDLKALDESY